MVSAVTAKQEKITPGIRQKTRTFFSQYELGSLSIFTILMIIFSVFMFLPILNVSVAAFNFSDLDPANPLDFFRHFIYCFENDFYRLSLINALFAGLTTTIITSVIGLTVTVIFSRYKFRGKRFFQVLTILPLVSPPFVGAFALSRLLDRNGVVSNFFQDDTLPWFIPGLPDFLGKSIWGIIFMQSLHLWPLIFLNASASYSKIDPAQEEQARNLGSFGVSLYRQIILPLITPGFVAGAVLVFMWSISDLGTPIVLDFFEYAPFVAFRDLIETQEAYVEGAYALIIIILFISLIALIFASKVVGMRDYSPEKVSGMEQARMMKQASRGKVLLIYLVLTTLFVISLLPHIGIILVAFVERIKIGEYIPTLWTLDGITQILESTEIMGMIWNSLIYSALAMILTIVVGIIVSYLIVRKKNLKGISVIMAVIGGYIGLILGAQLSAKVTPGSEKLVLMLTPAIIVAIGFFFIGTTLNLRCLEIFATMPFAIPGIVLAIGYVAFFDTPTALNGIWGLIPADLDYIPILGLITNLLRQSLREGIPDSPFAFRFTSFWFVFVFSYAMRRMPYAVQSSTAMLRQVHVSLEEVAHNLGATTATTLRRVTIPLMASGVLAGGILSFITSFTEVSTSIVLTPIKHPFEPFPFLPRSSLSKPLTKGLYDRIQDGDFLISGVMGLVQLLVATIGMAITQRLLGERTGTAFGG
ncbi:MAG: ABC transporter permease [Candidatus Thorarchaeota archaeon]